MFKRVLNFASYLGTGAERTGQFMIQLTENWKKVVEFEPIYFGKYRN